ncbi:MAG: nascent polypeptide-associated complex protein [Candidatus Hydrothermarchaeales archaeon]
MFPKINPRQMKKMMRQMGMKMDELDAEEVVIKLPDREIVIKNPSVTVVEVQNQKTYQVMGEERVVQLIPDADVKMVAEQANVSEEEARKALEESGGDLAEAILSLTS